MEFIFICRFTSTIVLDDPDPIHRTIEKLYNLLVEKLQGWTVTLIENQSISIETVSITVSGEIAETKKSIIVSWTNQDEDLGSYILGLLQNLG